MPQKEIKQPPCWWGSNTKMNGIHQNPLCVDEKEINSNVKDRKQWWLLSLRGTQRSGYFYLLFSLFVSGNWIINILTGNLTALWEYKHVRTWVSSISWNWTDSPFHFHFPPREIMIRLTFCHWRIMFVFNGIWLPNLLNKQAVEATVQSKQDRHVLRKTVEIFNSFLTALPRSARLPQSTMTSGVQMWSLVPNVFVCVWVCVFLNANVCSVGNCCLL